MTVHVSVLISHGANPIGNKYVCRVMIGPILTLGQQAYIVSLAGLNRSWNGFLALEKLTVSR